MSLDKEKLEAFIASLKNTREFLLCPQCNRLFVRPVKYVLCGHTVCSEHSGPTCFQCGRSTRDSEVLHHELMETAVKAMAKLEEIYAPYFQENDPIEAIEDKAHLQKTSETAETRKENVDLNNSRKHNEKRNAKGETALHIACRLHDINTIVKFLENGANPNTKDHAGWTPLHEVTQRGNLDAVKLLLKHGALPHVPGCDNETPLHEAVRYGHIEIAKSLIKHGADIKAKNIKGETPLSLSRDLMMQTLLNESKTQTKLDISTCVAAESEDVKVFYLSNCKATIAKLKKLEKSHNNLSIDWKFSPKVTHLILDVEEDNTCMCTIEVLQAVVKNLWILRNEWITDSNETKLEEFEKYEVSGIGSTEFDGPKRSRFNKYKQLPGLFDGCHFYLHGFNKPYEISKSLVLTKNVLVKLITGAGGKVLRREPNPESIPDSEKLVPYHAKEGGKLVQCAHFIIYANMFEPMYNMEHLKALPIGWFVECIQKYTLLDPF